MYCTFFFLIVFMYTYMDVLSEINLIIIIELLSNTINVKKSVECFELVHCVGVRYINLG